MALSNLERDASAIEANDSNVVFLNPEKASSREITLNRFLKLPPEVLGSFVNSDGRSLAEVLGIDIDKSNEPVLIRQIFHENPEDLDISIQNQRDKLIEGIGISEEILDANGLVEYGISTTDKNGKNILMPIHDPSKKYYSRASVND